MSRLIVDSLRGAIIEGKLAPGEALRQDALARHFEVSAIPVREALRQLETEGWIEVVTNKGATVSPLSADEALEIYEIRAALESLALGLAIPHHTQTSLAATETLLRAAADESDQALYVLRNTQFHLSLCQPAERPRLLKMIEELYQRGERYLRLKFGLPSFKDTSDAEHVAIFEAVRRGNVPTAQALITQHLMSTGDLLFRFLTDRSASRPMRST